MDEAAKLVCELQLKLAQLDHKVWQYQRDMSSEFEKYAEDLLREVPRDISETVSKTIAESMKGCRSLYPDGARPIESPATGSIRVNGAGQSQQAGTAPIPAAFQRRSTDATDDSPKSPQHEREKEFHGLFTPSYLPLLDSTSRNDRRLSPDPPPSPRQDVKGKQKEMDDREVEASEYTRSLSTTPEPKRPDPPRRRNTDSFSIASDCSGTTTPRSALRRSSISSKSHSPRRVRFDVMGEEVLPTASPRPFKPIMPEEIYPRSYPDSDEEAGSEQIEDVNSQPPKRVSSSQALRALSRSPLVDDGTEWTTVRAPPDGSASVATNGFQGSDDEDDQLEIGPSKAKMAALPSTASTISKKLSPNRLDDTNAVPPVQDKREEQAETPSDDEMLDMPPLRRQNASPASMLSPAIPADISGNKSPTASTRSRGKPLHCLETTGSIPQTAGSQLSTEEYDHDDLFHFDDGNVESQKSPPARKEQEAEDDSSEASESAADEPPVSPLKEPIKLSEYSSSPARDIVRPSARAKSGDTPTSKGIVGSYKGRPFSIPIVSPEVHAMAASLGDVNSFVGSVHDRPESDDYSFRASLRNSGTPRSFSERMRMEDIMEAEEHKRRGS
ncbi:hypothetical protein F5882DRAFT_401589 [Hyaloscypha sp. PMI_1271]|nr:hypothetical protein F5882DRAFT_401589 [Hyaloscypha sp. PMI_1271]